MLLDRLYNDRYACIMKLGKRLKLARDRRGMTQEQLAELASTDAQPISQPSLAMLEKRDSESTTHLFALARALRVNPEWLQTGEGESGLDRDQWQPPGVIDAQTRATIVRLGNELTALLHEALATGIAKPDRPLSLPEGVPLFESTEEVPQLRHPMTRAPHEELGRRRKPDKK